MKKIFVLVFLLAGGLIELGYGIQTGSGSPPPTATFIVKFAKGSNRGAVMSALKSAKGTVRRELSHVFDGAIVSLPLPAADALRKRADIERINLDTHVRLTATEFSPPWNLDRIDQRTYPLNNEFTYVETGAGVSVYVIDTGIYSAHKDFGGRVTAGFSAVNDANGTNDCNGHGTFVSGLAGGTYYGVAKGVTLVPVRVLGCDGTGSWADVIAGIDWVIGQHTSGIAIANLSLRGDPDALADEAVNALIADGVVVTVASGNDYGDACAYSPSRVPGALTVAATEANDFMAQFSNTGACVDLFAPGVGLASDYIRSDTDGVVMSGTSMSAPHVAGAAAIAIGKDKRATVAHIVNDILLNATRGVVVNIAPGTNNLFLYTPPGGFKSQQGLTRGNTTSTGTSTAK